MLRPSPSDLQLRWRVARLKALRGSHSEAGALGAGRRRSPASGSSPQEREPVPRGAIPFPGHRPSPLPGREPPARRFRAAFARSLARAHQPALSARARPPDDAGAARARLGSPRSLPPSAGPLRRRPRFPARRESVAPERRRRR